jgi:hypothetical protein
LIGDEPWGVARPLLFPLLSLKIKAWIDETFIPVSSSENVKIFYIWNAR